MSRRSTHSIYSAVPEYMAGDCYEYKEAEDEAPSQPRPSLDVRSLTLDTTRRFTGPLSWIDGDFAQLVISSVIMSQVIVMVNAWVYPETVADIFIFEQCVLLFYSVEMAIRITHYGRFFFVGHWSAVIWNYIDLLVVCFAIIEHWILLAAQDQISMLRIFRVLRLLRVIRLFYAVVIGDFAWVDSVWFQWLVGAVIGINALIMGLETDIENPCWWKVNQVSLSFFVFELAVRIRRAGSLVGFFLHGEEKWWNLVDCIIVLTGTFDQWLLPLYALVLQDKGTMEANAGFGQMMMLGRMMRLMRILRLLRLVKAVRPLYHLAVGIMRALQSMFWVLVLTMVALYACALLMTNLIGKGMVTGTETMDAETQALFSTVPDSLFTLFGLMNSQYWREVKPIFNALPWMKPVWVVFTILSSWALLSVMTGVVSDNMLEVRQQQEQKDFEQEEEFRGDLLRLIREVFTAADKDGSGVLEKQEYLELLSTPFHVRKLQRLAEVPIQDLVIMFDWVDVDEKGFITFEEFMRGFDWLNEPVTGKSLLKLESAVRQRITLLEREVGALGCELRRTEYLRQKQVEDATSLLRQAKDTYENEAKQRYQEAEAAQKEALEARAECVELQRQARDAEERARVENARAAAMEATRRRRQAHPNGNEERVVKSSLKRRGTGIDPSILQARGAASSDEEEEGPRRLVRKGTGWEAPRNESPMRGSISDWMRQMSPTNSRSSSRR